MHIINVKCKSTIKYVSGFRKFGYCQPYLNVNQFTLISINKKFISSRLLRLWYSIIFLDPWKFILMLVNMVNKLRPHDLKIPQVNVMFLTS